MLEATKTGIRLPYLWRKFLMVRRRISYQAPVATGLISGAALGAALGGPYGAIAGGILGTAFFW